MQLGSYFSSLIGGPPGPSRPFGTWVTDAEKLLKAQEQAGFSFAAFTHSYQTASGIQPFVLMSRLAAVSGNQRLATQVLLLPLLNAMDVASNQLETRIGEGAAAVVVQRDPAFEIQTAFVFAQEHVVIGVPIHAAGQVGNLDGLLALAGTVQKPLQRRAGDQSVGQGRETNVAHVVQADDDDLPVFRPQNCLAIASA